MTVRAKLTILTSVLMGASFACMGPAVHARLYSNLLGEVDRQLQADTNSVVVGKPADFPMPNPPPGGVVRATIRRGIHSTGADKMVQVLETGNVAARLEVASNFPRIIPLSAHGAEIAHAVDPHGVELAERSGRVFHEFLTNGEPMRSLSVPVPERGSPIAVVQAVRPLSGVRQQMGNLDRSLEMLVPLAMGISAIVGAAFVGVTMRPIKRLADSAKALRPDLLGSRLPISGRDEFAQLAETFNGALDRTAEAFERQRQAMAQLERFTGDAGHELRTPLASIKGAATYMLHTAALSEDCADSVGCVNRSADRMAKLIDDLLLLARHDGGQPPRLQDGLSLRAVIDEAREELAEPSGIEVCLAIPPNLSVRGDPDALRRVFLNLLSNAFAHARSRVEFCAVKEGDWVEVRVADDGEGIAHEHMARLGERFYRPDTARSRVHGGTGLGLAIAKSICVAHGGRLEIASVPGQGSTFTVVLPFAAERE